MDVSNRERIQVAEKIEEIIKIMDERENVPGSST